MIQILTLILQYSSFANKHQADYTSMLLCVWLPGWILGTILYFLIWFRCYPFVTTSTKNKCSKVMSVYVKLVCMIWNRFLTCQYQQLHCYVWNQPGADSEHLHRQWDRIVSRIKQQLILRAMSCMQLASKLANTSQVSFMYCH
jgi:hypothetical protein